MMHTDTIHPVPSRFCSNCGFLIDSLTSICPRCGAILKPSLSDPEPDLLLPTNPEYPVIETQTIQAQLYYNGAMLKKTGLLPIDSLPARFYIEGMEADTDPDQIRILFEDSSVRSQLHGICSVISPLSAQEQKRLEELNKKSAQLRERISLIGDQREALKNALNTMGRSTHTPEEEQAFFEAYPERMQALAASLQALNDEFGLVETGIEELKNRQKPIRVLEIEITSAKTEALPFFLTVQTGAVFWKPLYDLNICREENQIEAALKCRLHRPLGGDWKLETLTLFAGAIRPADREPSLSVWRIDVPAPVRRTYAAGFGAPNISSSVDASISSGMEMYPSTHMHFVPHPEEEAFNRIDAPSDGFLKQFQKQGPVLVRGNAADTVLRMMDFCVPAEFTYSAVPKCSSQVYVKACIRKASSCDFLNAPADLFMGSAFIGRNNLDSPDEKDELSISLGTDDTFRISRKTVTEKTSTLLTGAKKRTELSYEITVRNLSDQPRTLEIRDQIPVSVNSSITVTASGIQQAELDKDTGELLWILSLKPGQTLKLPFSVTITYPSSMNLRYK